MTGSVSDVLSAGHRAVLTEESGLPDDLVQARGYRSLTINDVNELVQAGQFPAWLLDRTDGWLSIPIYRPDGQHHCDIIRIDEYVVNYQDPDNPEKQPKYLWPQKIRNAVDIHPWCREYAADPTIPLVIAEGVKKGDAILAASRAGDSGPLCVVAINGCWGWKSSPVVSGATVASPDWGDVALDERRILIVPDSDYHVNPRVRDGWDGCAGYLASKTRTFGSEGDPKVLISVPPSLGWKKQGADDYLRDHSLADLISLARHYKSIEPIKVLTDIEFQWVGEMLDKAGDEVPAIVRGIFAEGSINAIAGHTQTFKTWLAMLLGLDLKLGLPWHEHPDLTIEVPGKPSLYVNKEMNDTVFGVRLRNLAIAERYVEHLSTDPFRRAIAHTSEARIDFRNDDIVRIMTDKIGENGFVACILDTFSMIWGGNENDSSEVGDLFMKLREITQMTKVIWVILHHLVKPSKDRAGINQLFHVRGSGQIIQQCDTALLLNTGKAVDDQTKEIIAYHAKGRLTGEQPSWLIHYNRDKDSGATTLTYQGRLTEVKAAKYAESHGDTELLTDWIHSLLLEQPAMHETGMRRPALIALLLASWPKDREGEKPSDRTVSRCLTQMGESGIVTIESNQRLGDLITLAVKDEEAEAE